MNNYPEEIKNMEALFQGRYNALMIENVIDLCF